MTKTVAKQFAKEISLDFIARMNRDYGVALLKGDPKPIAGGGAE